MILLDDGEGDFDHNFFLPGFEAGFGNQKVPFVCRQNLVGFSEDQLIGPQLNLVAL